MHKEGIFVGYRGYDVDAKQWRAHAATFGVLIGSSSDDIALRGEVTIAQDLLTK